MILIHYLKDRLLNIFLLIGSFCILSFIFSLYGLMLEAVFYAYLLILLFILVVGIIDFSKYVRQHQTLKTLQIEDNVTLSAYIDDNSLKGQDYRKILEVMNDKLIKTIEHNEEYQKEISDYFVLWAHQAKLPIAAMKLCIESETIDIKELKTQLLRMDQYTEMVLAYLKMNSLTNDYVFKECALDDMIRQAIRHFSSEFIYRKIKLDFKETNLSVLTDEKWFVFVLEQILSNALKYSNKEGTVKIYSKDWKLIIEDNGKGIDSSDLKRVFERGYTGYNGRLDKKASGIGLYLCKEILDKLNHEISIESKLNKGTKVTIQLERYDLGIE